jgi:hypothetical protein
MEIKTEKLSDRTLFPFLLSHAIIAKFSCPVLCKGRFSQGEEIKTEP